MASRKKEEERIERAIRALLKLPENRRCINCNSLGPQYVCMTFLTFVCTNCSGIHREFTHRVKSVSISRFTAEEVEALERVGNGRARQVYFKGWDPERHSYPDSSNLHKLREFIRQVYMDRRFSGENHKLQRLKLSDDEPYKPRVLSSFNRTRSPLHDDKFDPRYSERSSPAGRSNERSFRSVFEERRSPSLGRDVSSRRGSRRSTAFFEIVDNRVRDRDNRPGSARRRDGLMFSPGASRSRSSSPQNNMCRSCSPVARHGKDGKDADVSTQNQKVASSGTTGSADEKPKEQKEENTEKLIDFSMSPEPENPGSAQQTQQTTLSNNGSNEISTTEKASQLSSIYSLEDLLFGLSVTTTAPAANAPEGSTGSSETQQYMQQQHHPPSSVSLLLPPVALQEPLPPVDQQAIPSMPAPNSQPQASPVVPNAQTQAPSGGFSEQQFGPISNPNQNQEANSGLVDGPISNPNQNQEANSGLVEGPTSPLPSEVKPSGRTELPVDLFANFPEPALGWQIGPYHGIGYNMQQHYQNTPVFPVSAKSMNPFEIDDDAAPQLPALQFPSMDPRGLFYPPMMAPHSHSSFGPSMCPSTYPEQHMQNNIPLSRPQRTGGIYSEGDPFASLMVNPKSTGSCSAPNISTSIPSKGGNPFG